MNGYAFDNATAYKSVEVNSNNRLKLVVMIYDAAIASLKQAAVTHSRGDMQKRNQFISRTQIILHELNNSLNMQQGGEIADTLRKLYHFVNRHIGEVLTNNNPVNIEEAISILSQLREAWEEISAKAVDSHTGSHEDAAVYHGKEGKRITAG